MKLNFVFLFVAMALAIFGAGYFLDLGKPGASFSMVVVAICLGAVGLLWYLEGPSNNVTTKKHNYPHQ